MVEEVVNKSRYDCFINKGYWFRNVFFRLIVW